MAVFLPNKTCLKHMRSGICAMMQESLQANTSGTHSQPQLPDFAHLSLLDTLCIQFVCPDIVKALVLVLETVVLRLAPSPTLSMKSKDTLL